MGSTLQRLKGRSVFKQLREKNKNPDGERRRRGHREDLIYGVEALGKGLTLAFNTSGPFALRT